MIMVVVLKMKVKLGGRRPEVWLNQPYGRAGEHAGDLSLTMPTKVEKSHALVAKLATASF